MAVSLGTRRFREAEYLAGYLNLKFNGGLKHGQHTSAPLSRSPDLASILRDHLREALKVHLTAECTPGGPVPYALYRPEWLEALREDARGDLTRRGCGTPWLGHEVDALMARHGLPEGQRHGLAIGLLEAHLRVLDEAAKRARGEVPLMLPDQAPEPPVVAGIREALPSPAPAAPSKPLASALVEDFFEHRAAVAGATHQVMGQERATLRRFVEASGDRPIDTYQRGDINAFLGTLRRLPNTYGRSPRDKDRSLLAIIAEADANSAARLTEKTVKRHLSALSQFFQFAVDLGHVAVAARSEMMEGHRFRLDRGARKQRGAWVTDELEKLFASPVWTGCHAFYRTQAGPKVIRDAKFWLPLLALFHGARLEEFADLYRRDLSCDAGTWFVSLSESAGTPTAGRRRLKNPNATRHVPLHPELVRLGFLGYAQGIARKPDDPLFPDLLPQGKDRKRGPRITRWFSEYRRAVGIYRSGVAMHAFRHTAITRLTDAITDAQQVRHRDFIMGHAASGGEGSTRYDKGPGLKAVAATLALLTYPELDLSHLYPAKTCRELPPVTGGLCPALSE